MKKKDYEILAGHKALSKKSLRVVLQWADNNENNPLADAFLSACFANGGLDCNKISNVLKKDWQGKNKIGYIDEAYKPYELSFVYRDIIGRMILDMLRRQRCVRT